MDEEIIKKVKLKREFSGLADDFVKGFVERFLPKGGVKSKKDEKEIVKQVRAELRRYVGQYQLSKNSRRLKMLNSGNINDLLKSHTSTKERLGNYSVLENEIAKLNPRSILDLGCGLNPLALAPKFPKAKYFAVDINLDELELIKKFFKKENIKGRVFYTDLRKSFEFPKVDVVLILKVFDLIESDGRKLAEKIIGSVKSKAMIISFSTRKLSGKIMNAPRRYWFEKILSRLELDFKTFSIENEIFYLVKR